MFPLKQLLIIVLFFSTLSVSAQESRIDLTQRMVDATNAFVSSLSAQQRNNGIYAFDDEEWFNGMVGLSVPIFNKNNELCFCLSTHTAKSRKNIEDLKKILPSMQTAALNLKKILFKD